MKNRMFSKVGILLAAMVLINTALQAQVWLNPTNCITVHSGLSTDCYAQKVKPYKDRWLIGLSKTVGADRYCFTAWRSGDNTVKQGNLDTTMTAIVSDFTILNDMVYFCGTDYSQGSYQGFIGRFNIDDLLSSGNNFSYEITQIYNSEHIKRIVAYTEGDSPIVTHIIAISTGSYASGVPTFLLCMNDANNPNFEYGYLYTNVLGVNEVFDDITFGEKYIHTISRIHPTSNFIVRCFLKADPLNANYFSYHAGYSMPNQSAFNISYYAPEFPMHITMLKNGYFAISSSMTDGNDNFFTMVNVLKEPPYAILTTHLIPHNDKDNSILEMEYSAETDRLLVMNRIHTTQQPITMLKLASTPPYTTIMEWITTTKDINHFSIVPEKRYALAGIDASGSNFQSFSVKDIGYNANNCFSRQSILISAFQSLSPMSPPLINSQGVFGANWVNYSSLKTNNPLYGDCNE
ncbi:MAG: hypothetical protein ACI3Z9_07710 [Candidatus Onthomorpha sp.]